MVLNISGSMTSVQKTYDYLKNLLGVEYGDDLEQDQVIAKLNKRGMKTYETLNEYAAALREIGQCCRDSEERWYVNDFKRGVPKYVRGRPFDSSGTTYFGHSKYAID